MLNFENLDKAIFEGAGAFQIPEILPVEYCDITDFIPFNYVLTHKHDAEKGVHFFIDDYQFARVWNAPNSYVDMLRKFKCILAPDFSTYTDMPVALQIYNHYRKHWIARYYSMWGITVIPTISWSTPESFDWCFDGEPENSVVAVSNVGCMRDEECRELFFKGFEEMKRRLSPSKILCYGSPIDGTVNIPPFYEKIRERRETANDSKTVG